MGHSQLGYRVGHELVTKQQKFLKIRILKTLFSHILHVRTRDIQFIIYKTIHKSHHINNFCKIFDSVLHDEKMLEKCHLSFPLKATFSQLNFAYFEKDNVSVSKHLVLQLPNHLLTIKNIFCIYSDEILLQRYL